LDKTLKKFRQYTIRSGLLHTSLPVFRCSS